MKRDYYFLFSYTYAGQSRTFKVDAPDKQTAIDKAINSTCKKLNIKRCELTRWDCYLVRNYNI